MSTPETTAKPAKAPVIQLVRGAELTAGERVLHRILPACVASAGIHLLLAGGVGLYAWLNPTAEAKPATQEVAVAVEQRPDSPEPEDLTDTSPSLDDTVATTALDDTDRVDTKTIETKLNDPEPAGNPDGNLTTPIDSKLAAGADTANLLTAGMDATGPGQGMIGGGAGGLVIANPSFAGRGESTTRDALAKANGGTAESQQAVGKGLVWLAKQQRKDGYWEFDGSSRGDRVAATGLALLPFLAAGSTHKKGKENKYQETVEKGLAYLIAQQRKAGDGAFSKGAYSHGIASVAICEAFGMTSDKQFLLRPAQAAVDYIEKAQGPNGSWGYNAGTEGDTSIVGWQIQALHSAKLCKDLKVSPRVMDRAIKFLDSVASGSSKSKYGYATANTFTPTRTAVGLLCRYYLNGWGKDTPGMRDGVDYLLAQHKPDEKAEYDMYYYYYATQVLHFHEGAAWEKEWNPKMRDLLIAKQRKDPPGVEGSWDADTSPWIGNHCGRLGTTCMALLTLEVYYRHLPLYGRGTGGKSDLEGK
jgi:hypothetical protein